MYEQYDRLYLHIECFVNGLKQVLSLKNTNRF